MVRRKTATTGKAGDRLKFLMKKAWGIGAWLFILCTASGGIMITFSGCSTDSGSYHDNKTYPSALYGNITRRSFAYEGPARNPVIVIHGLLGARLEDIDAKENIWGNFALSEMMSGEKFGRLAHPMGNGRQLKDLHSSVKAAGLLEKAEIQVAGVQFRLDNYDILVKTLEDCGYVPDTRPLPENKHFHSLFIFYYDWRRDISENAVELEKFIRKQRAYLRKEYEQLYGLKDYNVRFDLIAHSMGGLLARYFVRYGGTLLPEKEEDTLPVTWDGGKYVNKVVIIGTPNAGYVDTLLELTEGLRLVTASPAYPKAVIGSFPSYYQMLPNAEGKHIVWEDSKEPVDYFALETWLKLKWGLADPKQDKWLKKIMPEVATAKERRSAAIDHLDKCLRRARQFKKAMQIHAEAYPDNIAVYLIAGDAVPTNHTLGVNPKDGTLKVLDRDAGDGKITAASARLDLRDGGDWLFFTDSPINWSGVYYFQGSHMGIMNSEVFNSNLRFILMGLPTPRQRCARDEYRNLIKKADEYQNGIRGK